MIECDECMNARATEVCPTCGKDLCEYCLDDHDCEIEEDYSGED